MRFSVLALAAAIASVATASILPFSAHQVVPEDAIGIFRVAGVPGLGCPNRIQHTETVNEDGVIPHSAIRHNSEVNCDEGEMTIFTDAEAAMGAVEAQSSKDFITNFADSNEDAVFGVELSGRTCGGTSFNAGTVVILFTPEETLELSTREAFPAGRRYMIIDDPITPGTCTYQTSLRVEETPEPPAPTPAGDGGQGSPDGEGGQGGPDGEGGQGDREVPTETPGSEGPDGSGGSGIGVPPIGGRPGNQGNGDGSNGGTGQGDGDGTDGGDGSDGGDGDGSNGGTGQGDGDGTDGSDGGDGTDGSDGGDGTAGGVGDGSTTDTNGESTPQPEETPVPSGDVDSDGEDDGDDDDGSVCFPADAEVETEDGTTKMISDVQIGDRVKVANGIYSDVYMFTHKDANTVHDFVSLSSASGEKISATRGHYLYINGRFAAAVSAKVGDVLELGNGARTTIKTVAIEKKVGLFNPQTVHGDIIVNSVRASTFTRTIEPQTAQALLAPLRMMYDVIGVSASFLNNGADAIAALLPKGQVSL